MQVDAMKQQQQRLLSDRVELIDRVDSAIRTDGRLGGFSASGGTAIKERLLRHEQATHLAGGRI